MARNLVRNVVKLFFIRHFVIFAKIDISFSYDICDGKRKGESERERVSGEEGERSGGKRCEGGRRGAEDE